MLRLAPLSPVVLATAFTLFASFATLSVAADGSFALPTDPGESATRTVAAHEDLVVVAGTQNDTMNGKYGYAAVFQRGVDGTFTHQQTLRASDASADSLFGHSITVTTDLIVVSAIGDGSFQGAAYVFESDAGTWSQTAKLTAGDGASLDFFGGSVDCTEDRIVVGAWGDGNVAGSAYVFDRDGASWAEDSKLLASDGTAGDAFGKSVAVSGDAVAVGATDRAKHAGAVYVFRNAEGSWTQEVTLTATSGASGDFFGSSVDMEGDVVAVGSPSADTPLKDSGSVYVFTKSGSAWSQFQHLTAQQAAGDALGHSVCLSGGALATTAPATASQGTGSSSAVVWKQGDPQSAWIQDRRVSTTDTGSAQTVGIAGTELVASPSSTATTTSTFDLN